MSKGAKIVGGGTTANLEPPEIAKMRQRFDHEIYELRLELAGLRRANAAHAAEVAQTRDVGQTLLGMLVRYHRTLRALGWAPPDDELALVEKIRKDLER